MSKKSELQDQLAFYNAMREWLDQSIAAFVKSRREVNRDIQRLKKQIHAKPTTRNHGG